MKKSICIFVAVSTLIVSKSHAQQTFSLVDMNKMVLNPAYTGIDTTFKHEASLYAQSYMNSNLSGYANNSCIGTYQMRLDKINSGVGFMFNYNYSDLPNYETYNQLAFKLYYRYTIIHGLSIGTDAGFVNFKANYQYSEACMTPNMLKETTNNLDLDGDIGVLYQYKSMYAGLSFDHITSPQATNPVGELLSQVNTYQMPNYTGIAYNWIIGGSSPIGKCAIDLSANYYQLYTLNLNATLNTPHFFIGFSALQENSNENSIFEQKDSYYYAFIAGVKACHNKVKVSFAYNFQFNSQSSLLELPTEGGVSYSF